jgi:hypothetical protein
MRVGWVGFDLRSFLQRRRNWQRQQQQKDERGQKNKTTPKALGNETADRSRFYTGGPNHSIPSCQEKLTISADRAVWASSGLDLCVEATLREFEGVAKALKQAVSEVSPVGGGGWGGWW